MPEPLRKYLPGAPEFIPYSKELPKETAAKKTAKDKNVAKTKPVEAKQKVVEAGQAAAAAVSDAAEKVKNLAV